jgi:hypothetical protein
MIEEFIWWLATDDRVLFLVLTTGFVALVAIGRRSGNR